MQNCDVKRKNNQPLGGAGVGREGEGMLWSNLSTPKQQIRVQVPKGDLGFDGMY